MYSKKACDTKFSYQKETAEDKILYLLNIDPTGKTMPHESQRSTVWPILNSRLLNIL